MTLISIVIPCFNEEESLAFTISRLVGFTETESNYQFELIFVNDGSTDNTRLIIDEAENQDPRIRALSLSRNFGHQNAVSAGLFQAKGEAIVIIDADLQDPPEVISLMLRQWEKGYMVAYGHRVVRHGESRFKKLSAVLFYKFLSFMADVNIPRNVGDFRLVDRKVLDELNAMPERNKFYRGLIGWTGFRSIAVDYERQPRIAGKTKYPIRKMLSLASGAIISFSTKPLKILTISGFVLALAAIFGAAYFAIARLITADAVPGWTALIVVMLFLGGIQLIAIGIVGMYVARIYTEAQSRPDYIIDPPR